MNSIVCPHCNKTVELSEALVHGLREEVLKEQEEKHKLELEKAKKEAQLLAEKEVKEKVEKQLESSKVANEKLEEQIEKLKKEQEEAEKKLKEEELKIRSEAKKEAEERSKFEVLELKKRLEDTQKSLEDAKRKAEQKSQQLQGEILELDFENQLKATFPDDEFIPVPKGVEGGDIWQKVIYKGAAVGSILWELKRTKAWSKGWTVKLKNDAARISASQSVIVSSVLPDEIKNFARIDGVWITTYEHAISVCRYVRFLITTVASLKSSTSKTEEEWGKVRDYMLSDSFVHRMQAHYDVIKALKDILDAERRSTQLRWKRQEDQILKLDNNTTSFYGELKAIVKELPELEGLNSTLLTQDNESSDTPLL